MNRVIALARIAARRIRSGTDPVEAVAAAINSAVAESVIPELGFTDPSGETFDLRTVQWAVYLGCTTPRRLADQWSIPLRQARELLGEAKARGLLGKGRGRTRNGFSAPRPGEPGTIAVYEPRVVAARRSA